MIITSCHTIEVSFSKYSALLQNTFTKKKYDEQRLQLRLDFYCNTYPV